MNNALPLVQLREIVDPVDTWNPTRESPGAVINYIDIGAVDQAQKVIIRKPPVLGVDAPSRARQKVKYGDVLVSTVRPNLNSVARVPEDLDGATASTGFCVLRPKENVLDPGYLFHWVRSPAFVAKMARLATGQSYPAVSDRIVLDSEITHPPIDEQRRIAAILDKADALRQKRRQALALLDQLSQSIFIEMFGDVAENDRGWPAAVVGDFVAGFETGKNLAAGDEDDVAAAYRVLKVSAVTSLTYKPEQSKPLPEDYTPPDTHIVQTGDLLFSRANTSQLIGATAMVETTPDNIALPDKLWRFVWHEKPRANAYYVWHLFQQPRFREEISRRATGTSGSMKNISQSKVLTIPTVLPPLDLQAEFGRRLQKIQLLRDNASTAISHQDGLFSSLQQRAFSGEL